VNGRWDELDCFWQFAFLLQELGSVLSLLGNYYVTDSTFTLVRESRVG
jgi:hypothetical protein